MAIFFAYMDFFLYLCALNCAHIGMLQKTNIEKPFDPSLIDVDITVINLGYLLDQLSYGIIDLMPDFQRSGNLWKPWQKSRLVESILLGLPLPSFYFSEYYDEESGRSKYQVIDGLQRLSALTEFVFEQSLRLTGLQFLKQYEGCTWEELGKVEQMNFRSLKVTINTLRKGTPANVKYVIFQRVNTAGVPLSPQEMRWALNQGPATKMLVDMATYPAFMIATCGGISHKRMEHLDYANRFVAFYLYMDRYFDYGSLDDFLNAALERINETDGYRISEVEDAFAISMYTCADIFGNDAFRRRVRIEDRRRRISKALFDALSVNIAKLTNDERQQLILKKEDVKQSLMQLFGNGDFNDSISTGTGNTKSVFVRFSMIKEMIQKILYNA